MKRKKLGLLIISFVLLGFLIFIGNSIITTSNSDINVDFIRDTVYNDNVSIVQSYNNIEQEQYSQDFKGTYSFTNESVGTSKNNIGGISGFTTTDTNGNVSVIAYNKGHNKVLNNTGNGDNNTFTRFLFNFDDQIKGTIEMWFKYIDHGQGYFRFCVVGNTDDVMLYVYFDSATNKLYYIYSTIWNNINIEPNVWTHISFDFDTDTDKQTLRINGVTMFTNQNFYYNRVPLTMNYAYYYLDNGGGLNKLEGYIDAIGYSWDSFYTSFNKYHFKEFDIDQEFDNIEPYTLWTYTHDTNCIASIKNNTGINDKYLSFINNNYNGKITIENIFSSSYIKQIFSFYIRISSNQGFFEIAFRSSTNLIGTWLIISNGNLYAMTPSATLIGSFSINTWQKLTVIYNTDVDTYYLYWNNVYINTYNFYEATTNINKVMFRTGEECPNYYTDLDLVSKDYDYWISDNFKPISTLLGYYSSQYYNFLIENPNVKFSNGDDNPYDLMDYEVPSGDDVNLDGIGNYVFVSDKSENRGFISQPVPLIYDNLVELYFNFTITTNTTSNSNILLSISSMETVELYCVFTSSNFYYTDQYYNYYPLNPTSQISTNANIEFYFYINYYYRLVFLDYFKNNVYIQSFYFPTHNVNPFIDIRGLYEYEIQLRNNDATTSQIILKLHTLQLKRNGYIHSQELGYYTYHLDIDWILHHSNLLYGSFTGKIAIGTVEGTYTIGESYYGLDSTKIYDNNVYINLYETTPIIYDSTLVIFIVDNYIPINELEIYGIKVRINEINTYLSFTYASVDKDYSFFYNNNDTYLYWNYYADDTNLEYIKATFDIVDFTSTNKSISYMSYNNGDSIGYIDVNFLATSNQIIFPNYYHSDQYLLTQNKMIKSFAITITDNDLDYIEGYTYGYIKNLKFKFVYNIGLTLLTINLINSIIPIIIILIPTLAFYSVLGKRAIIPSFLLMSIVCFISDLIPLWLLFVIILSNSISLFIKYESEV